MDRRAPVAMLTGVIVAVTFAAIATGGEVKLVERAPSFARDPTPERRNPTTAPVTTVGAESDRPVRLEVPPVIEVIVQVFFYACLTIFAITVLAFIWRHRPDLRLRLPSRQPTIEFDVLDDAAAAITADAEFQRSALQRGAPRNAIVECWLRLEAAVGDVGVHRYPSDTSAEFTQRVLATVSVDPAPVSALAALYREARFSNHPMTEDSRRAAIEALGAVHDGLRSGRRNDVTIR